MSKLSEKELEAIREAVKGGVSDIIGDLLVDRKQHYEDHGFVFRIRKGIGTVRTGTLWTAGVAIFCLILWVVEQAVAEVLLKGVTP